MGALGGFISGVGVSASTALAVPVGLLGLIGAGIMASTGNRGGAQAMGVGAIIGTGVVLAAGEIMNHLPAITAVTSSAAAGR